MDDQDVERLLRRYVPAGPPPGLRARIRRPTPRLWPWAAAASALLAATLGLRLVTERTAASVNIDSGPDSAQLAVDDLTEMLGGDEAARRYAEATISRVRAQAASGPDVAAVVDEGGEAQ